MTLLSLLVHSDWIWEQSRMSHCENIPTRGEPPIMATRHFQQVQARSELDQALNKYFGVMQVITRSELERFWGNIKDVANPERLEHWLKETGKQICPQCAEFLRKKLGFSVSMEFIAIA
jgi:hypothetical protein